MQEQLSLGSPKPTRCSHSPLIKPKGPETSGGEVGEEFISMRPTPGRPQTNGSKAVSEMPKIFPALYEEMWGKGQWYVQVGSEGLVGLCLGVNDMGSCWLRKLLIA